MGATGSPRTHEMRGRRASGKYRRRISIVISDLRWPVPSAMTLVCSRSGRPSRWGRRKRSFRRAADEAGEVSDGERDACQLKEKADYPDGALEVHLLHHVEER